MAVKQLCHFPKISLHFLENGITNNLSLELSSSPKAEKLQTQVIIGQLDPSFCFSLILNQYLPLLIRLKVDSRFLK